MIVLLVSVSLVFGNLVATASADNDPAITIPDGTTASPSTASPAVTDPIINTIITDVPTPTITLEATKVICDTSAASPHWGNGTVITGTSASSYVTQSNGHCHLASGWNFQWSNQSTNPWDIANDAIGEAAGFTTFGPTDANGSTTAIIPFPATTTQFHVREVLQSGYIPFTFNEQIRSNGNPNSAEFYCETDGLNYDNFEYIRTPQANGTYHCVAFNVPTTPPVTPPVNTQSPTIPPIIVPPVTTQTPTTNGGVSGGGFAGGGGPGFATTAPIGQVLGASTVPKGQVLGDSTSCGEYITSYVKLGQKNNAANVTNLQAFLNSFMHTSITIDGKYGPQTFAAVEQFQQKESDQVLLPWKNISNPNLVPTGYVYKTTKREINNIVCPALNLPIPLLP